MKNVNIISTILLFVMTGCGGNSQKSNEKEAFFTVDIKASYPKKDLILQDFMDVEYIALETGKEFYTQGVVLAIGKEIIVVKNRVDDGDIFIFDRNGKGLRKINRKGQGGEEYVFVLSVALDEDNSEMFVNSHSTRRILVYDLYGKFKRSFRHKEGAMYNKMYNYDKEHLICQQEYFPTYDPESNRNSIFIISKQDGSVKEVEVPFEKKISTVMMMQQGEWTVSNAPRNHIITPFQSNWILAEPSSDTVYRYLPDGNMRPFIARTPSVHSMEPEVFLYPGVLTDKYYFIQNVKKEYDFATNKGFPRTDLVYDVQEKSIFICTVFNGDYTNERPVNMFRDPGNEEIAFWQSLEADHLFEFFEKGQLKGKLKEIATGLDEEANPVIMLVKHKK